MCVANQIPKEKSQQLTSEIYEQILLTNQIVSTVRYQEGERENRAKGKVKVAGLWEISDTFQETVFKRINA